MPINFINKIVDLIFSNSSIFDKFRNFVHDDYKNEKRVISENFSKDKKTLDFGCGIGQFSALFDSQGYYGVDTDIKYINFCRKNQNGNFSLIKTSPPYNFNNGYFDQMLLSAVIHHIDDKKLIEISRELKRILKQNGKLMVIDHFTKENQRRPLCRFLIRLDRGRYFRNPEEALKLFSKYFKLEKTITFSNGPYKDYVLVLKK